jgi:L-threonylcarbamoyladenylate synthase
MTRLPAKILFFENGSPAVDALRAGEVVGMPTETVYGLAGNAFDGTAVTKIFEAKERPSFDPLIVHVSDDLNSVSKLAGAGIVDSTSMSPSMIKITDSIMREFWPGPLTIILPKNDRIPDLVTSGLGRVGIRMPAHVVAQKLLKACGLPLAAPSANRFGRISPTTAQHVFEELGDRIPYIIDGGRCEIGVESTVISVDEDCIWLLRPGKISGDDLAKCAGIVVKPALSIHEKASPGMLASHYAPQKPMHLIGDLTLGSASLPAGARDKKVALLIASGDGCAEAAFLAQLHVKPVATFLLTPRGIDSEAAQSLFAGMRELDKSPAEIILASAVPSTKGLWLAISDRMRRASTKNPLSAHA